MDTYIYDNENKEDVDYKNSHYCKKCMILENYYCSRAYGGCYNYENDSKYNVYCNECRQEKKEEEVSDIDKSNKKMISPLLKGVCMFKNDENKILENDGFTLGGNCQDDDIISSEFYAYNDVCYSNDKELKMFQNYVSSEVQDYIDDRDVCKNENNSYLCTCIPPLLMNVDTTEIPFYETILKN